MLSRQQCEAIIKNNETIHPQDKLGYLFWQISMHWVRTVNQEMQELGLTHTQLITLAATKWLSEEKVEVLQRDVVEVIKVDRMLVSKMVKKMVDAGYLLKERSITDSRMQVLSLTEAGNELMSTAFPKMKQIENDFFGQFGASKQTITHQLQRFLELVEEPSNPYTLKSHS